MKTRWIWAVAALQVLALAWMAMEREWVIRTGQVVLFRTSPLDPRDLMRGDYVRLDYPINHPPRAQCRDGLLAKDAGKKDTRVYASLHIDEENVAQLVTISDRPPEKGPFIRGRLEHSYGEDIRVRYGIEAYFMQQGTALMLETSRRQGDFQIPLDMEVALGGNGLAVLKGARSCLLGVAISLARRDTNTTRGTINPLESAIFQLKNVSSNDVAIVDLPDAASLELIPVNETWQPNPWQSAVSFASRRKAPRSEDVILLKPGAIHSITIRFDDPQWALRNTTPSTHPRPLMSIPKMTGENGARFRLAYRPPSQKECKGLPHAALLQHGYVMSSAFTPFGRVD